MSKHPFSDSQTTASELSLTEARERIQFLETKLFESEKMAMLGQMVASIAHEINNPVNFLGGGVQGLKMASKELLDLLQELHQFYQAPVEKRPQMMANIEHLLEETVPEELAEDVHHFMNSMEVGVKRVMEIIYGLRTFSRLDETHMQTSNIHDGLETTLIILRSRYKENIEVTKEFAEKLPSTLCFLGQLNQVFMNIISNAIDAIEGEGRIAITTQVVDDQIWTSIQDSGSGMSEEVKGRLFEPLFTTKGVTKGTGLGLAISKSIIDKHEGEIEVSSELGKGSTFVIKLPIR